jgi:hypothetical protein
LQAHDDTPSKRRPMSMIATPTYRSRSGGLDSESNGICYLSYSRLDQPTVASKNLYKERLEKIQRQFRGGDAVEDSDEVAVLEKPAETGGKMRPVSMDPSLIASRESKMNAGETQTYEALKERLNRMKLNMENK